MDPPNRSEHPTPRKRPEPATIHTSVSDDSEVVKMSQDWGDDDGSAPSRALLNVTTMDIPPSNARRTAKGSPRGKLPLSVRHVSDSHVELAGSAVRKNTQSSSSRGRQVSDAAWGPDDAQGGKSGEPGPSGSHYTFNAQDRGHVESKSARQGRYATKLGEGQTFHRGSSADGAVGAQESSSDSGLDNATPGKSSRTTKVLKGRSGVRRSRTDVQEQFPHIANDHNVGPPSRPGPSDPNVTAPHSLASSPIKHRLATFSFSASRERSTRTDSNLLRRFGRLLHISTEPKYVPWESPNSSAAASPSRDVQRNASSVNTSVSADHSPHGETRPSSSPQGIQSATATANVEKQSEHKRDAHGIELKGSTFPDRDPLRHTAHLRITQTNRAAQRSIHTPGSMRDSESQVIESQAATQRRRKAPGTSVRKASHTEHANMSRGLGANEISSSKASKASQSREEAQAQRKHAGYAEPSRRTTTTKHDGVASSRNGQESQDTASSAVARTPDRNMYANQGKDAPLEHETRPQLPRRDRSTPALGATTITTAIDGIPSHDLNRKARKRPSMTKRMRSELVSASHRESAAAHHDNSSVRRPVDESGRTERKIRMPSQWLRRRTTSSTRGGVSPSNVEAPAASGQRLDQSSSLRRTFWRWRPRRTISSVENIVGDTTGSNPLPGFWKINSSTTHNDGSDPTLASDRNQNHSNQAPILSAQLHGQKNALEMLNDQGRVLQTHGSADVDDDVQPRVHRTDRLEGSDMRSRSRLSSAADDAGRNEIQPAHEIYSPGRISTARHRRVSRNTRKNVFLTEQDGAIAVHHVFDDQDLDEIQPAPGAANRAIGQSHRSCPRQRAVTDSGYGVDIQFSPSANDDNTSADEERRARHVKQLSGDHLFAEDPLLAKFRDDYDDEEDYPTPNESS